MAEAIKNKISAKSTEWLDKENEFIEKVRKEQELIREREARIASGKGDKGLYASDQEVIAAAKDRIKRIIAEYVKVLENFNFVKLYKGWIPDRFEEVSGKKFSFAHIDVDLYEPTRDSLEFFFPRLVEGGSIVVDDYGMSQFPGCKKAVDEFLNRNECKLFYEMPAGGCFMMK